MEMLRIKGVFWALLLMAAPSCFAFTITPYDPPDTVAAPVPSGEGADVDSLDAVAPARTDEAVQTVQPAPAAPRPRPTSAEELGRLSRDDLFRMAFGRAAPARSRNLVVTLFSDGRSLGRTELLYDAAFTSFQFISPNFSKYLDSLLLPDERAKAGDSVGYFSSAVMSAAGYVLQVDDNMFELRAAAPPSSKREQRTNLQGGYVRRAVGEAIEPAFFSTLANYRLTGGAMYRWRGDTGPAMFGGGGLNEFSRWPLNLTVDAAATMFDWTLEAAGGANEPYWDQGVTWNNVYRGDVRLVRDIVPWEGRFSLGDVAMSFGGGTVGGARYERNGGFYGKEYDDGSRVSFFMPKAGEVAIFMDGFYRQRIYLPAGRHELTGFGGHTGMNSVRLVLRFVDGTTEEIPYEYILGDLRNLLARETRYSVTAGVARAVAPAPTYYTYDIDDPSLSVDYNYGLTRTLSVGASGASTRHNNVARVQASVDMGPVGWSSAGLSANYAPDSVQPARSYGWRADASYMPKISLLVDLLSYIIRGGEATGPVPAVSLSVRGYFQSPYYNPAAFSAQPLLVTTMGGVSGNLGFSLFRGSVMASAGATVYRPDSTGAAAPMSYNYGGRIAQTVLGVPVSVSGGMEVSNGVGRPYFSVAMSHGFGMGANYNSRFRGHQIRVTSGLNTGISYTPATLREVDYPDPDTAQGDIGIDGLPKYELVEEELNARVSGNAGVGWQWSNGGTGIGAQTYMASASVPDILNPTIPGVSAGMQRTMNRGSLTAGYAVAFADGGTQRHSLSAALAGSLMMADGVWALGRQTTGGFILVDTRYSLKGARVHVDRSHFYEQDYSRSGWFGAAYKADVTGYVPTSITITLTDPPPGAVLENNLYFATGGYKQGFALRLGSLYSVMLEARFTDRGAPLAYTYATVTPEGDMDKSGTRATFTSNAGTLQLGGLLPGETYRISFGSGIKDILLEIPANTDLVYEPSDIAVERE